jgi:hypothetical protein
MHQDPIYSSSLSERLEATNAYLHSKESKFGLYWPEGLRGALNAYAVLVGPSYGKFNGTGECFAGGIPRPTSKHFHAFIGEGVGLNPFPDGSTSRQTRWNKLLLACLETEDAVLKLSAIFNLDWGHHSSEKCVHRAHPEYFIHGASVVASSITGTRPRIIVPLTKTVWSYLIPALLESGATLIRENNIQNHQSLTLRLRGCDFESIVVRPWNHPSWHYLTTEKIAQLAKGLAEYKSA